MVRKINLTRGENLIKKPNSYARESYEKLNEYEAVRNLTSTKGINHCYDINCQSTNIIYDSNRDEVYCHECGTVLRQEFNDYEDTILNSQDNTLEKPYRNIDYYHDLFQQTEHEILGTI